MDDVADEEVFVAFVLSHLQLGTLEDYNTLENTEQDEKKEEEVVSSEDEDETFASEDAEVDLYDPFPQLQDEKRNGSPSVPADLSSPRASPFSLFSLFLKLEDVKNIVSKTNKYASKNRTERRPWEPLTVDEFYHWLGLLLYRELFGYPIQNTTGEATAFDLITSPCNQ